MSNFQKESDVVARIAPPSKRRKTSSNDPVTNTSTESAAAQINFNFEDEDELLFSEIPNDTVAALLLLKNEFPKADGVSFDCVCLKI